MITVNGKKLEWHSGITIRDIFKAMNYDYALITVTVNESSIHPDDYDSFNVDDESDVKMVHICHGG